MAGYKQTLINNSPVFLYSFDGATDFTEANRTGYFVDEVDKYPPAQLTVVDAIGNTPQQIVWKANSIVSTESFGEAQSSLSGSPAFNNINQANTSGSYLIIDPTGYTDIVNVSKSPFTYTCNIQIGSMQNPDAFNYSTYSADHGRNMSFFSTFSAIASISAVSGNTFEFHGSTGADAHLEIADITNNMVFKSSTGISSIVSNIDTSLGYLGTNTYTESPLKVKYLFDGETRNYASTLIDFSPFNITYYPTGANSADITVKFWKYLSYTFSTTTNVSHVITVTGDVRDSDLVTFVSIYVDGLIVNTQAIGFGFSDYLPFNTAIKYIGQPINWVVSSYPGYHTERLNIATFPISVDNVAAFNTTFLSDKVLDLFFKSMTYDDRVKYNSPSSYYKFDMLNQYISSGYSPYDETDDLQKYYYSITINSANPSPANISYIPSAKQSSARKISIWGNNAKFVETGNKTVPTALSLSNGSHISSYNKQNQTQSGISSQLYNFINVSSDFTLMFWISTTDAYGTIVSAADFESPYNGFDISIRGSVLQMTVGKNVNNCISSIVTPQLGGLPPIITTSPTVVNDGQYHHILIRNKSKTLELWVDGSICSSMSYTTITPGDVPSELVIGNSLPRNNGLDCNIGLLAVYPKAIITDYIGAYYRSATQYNFDGLVTYESVGVSVPVRIYDHVTGNLLKNLISDISGNFTWQMDYDFPVDILIQDYQNKTGNIQVLGPVYPSP